MRAEVAEATVVSYDSSREYGLSSLDLSVVELLSHPVLDVDPSPVLMINSQVMRKHLRSR
jgi:hypothetical protein